VQVLVEAVDRPVRSTCQALQEKHVEAINGTTLRDMNQGFDVMNE
jgi:hypothetical protein